MERETISQLFGLVVLPLFLAGSTAIAVYGLRERVRGWHLGVALAVVGLSGVVMVTARRQIEADKGSWGALFDLLVLLGAVPVAIVSATAAITILILLWRDR